LPDDEQNELQEGRHGASFVGYMLNRCLLGITLLLTSSVTAQVSGDVSDLQAGLVAKWDELMPMLLDDPLALPKPADGMKLGDFAVSFMLRLEGYPGGDHALDFLWMTVDESFFLRFDAPPERGLLFRREWNPTIIPAPSFDAAKAWQHVVVNIKRDVRQPLSGLWTNGVEVQAWREAPGTIELKKAEFLLPGVLKRGQIANLRLYNRALTRPEILELAAMAPMTGLKPKLEPFTGSMKLMTEEVVAVLGGTEAVAMMEEGTMEALMLTQFPGSRVKVRSLAWEADTVFRQDRPMNFGGLKQQLVRSGSTAAMLMFGRQECLERGEAGLAEFRAALEKLVTLCAEVTPRLVLLEPPSFEGELSKHNATLKKYAALMAEVAKAHGALFAAQDGDLKPGSTRDGLTLTVAGAAQLGMRVAKLWGGDAKAPDERLRTLIGEKNGLWHRYWRPANWAFLHGDRTAQPSSRDHTDPTQRWFPGEVEQFKPLIEAKENELWKLANDLGGKLP
jgi:hypothetical protein